MKVSELITALQSLDQDAIVLIDGYEGDLESIAPPKAIWARFMPNTAWYYGQFKQRAKRSNATQAAVHIGRRKIK